MKSDSFYKGSNRKETTIVASTIMHLFIPFVCIAWFRFWDEAPGILKTGYRLDSEAEDDVRWINQYTSS
jgi:hypothetical protein